MYCEVKPQLEATFTMSIFFPLYDSKLKSEPDIDSNFISYIELVDWASGEAERELLKKNTKNRTQLVMTEKLNNIDFLCRESRINFLISNIDSTIKS